MKDVLEIESHFLPLSNFLLNTFAALLGRFPSARGSNVRDGARGILLCEKTLNAHALCRLCNYEFAGTKINATVVQFHAENAAGATTSRSRAN